MSNAFNYFGLFLFCFTTIVLTGQSRPITIDKTTKKTNLNEQVLIFSDSSNRFSIHDILSVPVSAFKSNQNSEIHFRYDTNTNWIQVPIKCNHSQKMVLEVSLATLHKVNLYVYHPKSNQLLYSQKSGFSKHFFLNNTTHRSYTLPFEIQENEDYILLIEAQSLLSSYTLPITLWEAQAFEQHEVYDHLFWGLFSGGFLLIVCFGTFLFITQKDIIYFFYSLYALSFHIWQVNNLGFLPYRLSIFPGFVHLDNSIFYGYFLFYFFIQFSTQYLDAGISTKGRLFKKYYNYFLILCLFVSLFTITPSTSLRSVLIFGYNITFLVGLTFVLFLLTKTIRRGSKTSQYYLVAVMPLTILFVLHRLSKLFPDMPLANLEYYYAVVTFFEMITMMFGLTLRFKQYRDQREALLIENAEKQEEKIKISRELHDNIGAQFTVIKSSVEEILKSSEETEKDRKLALLRDFSARSIRELRNSIWSLNQETISLENIKFRLLDYTSFVRSTHNGIQIRVNCEDNTEQTLDTLFAMNLLSVIQEAISNALKYAECSKIEIDFYFSETGLNIRITDNGKGFILEQETTDSYGLRNMKKRMDECNAVFTIASDSSGTVIHIKKTTA